METAGRRFNLHPHLLEYAILKTVKERCRATSWDFEITDKAKNAPIWAEENGIRREVQRGLNWDPVAG